MLPTFGVPGIAWLPVVSTLTRVAVPTTLSRTKTSVTLLVSPATRFVAPDRNAT